MENEIKKDRITTDETLRETASHGSEEYPFSYYYEDIWDFDFHCIDWHWHPEVEFVYVQHGKADFLVGGNRYVLSSGDGIFINSQGYTGLKQKTAPSFRTLFFHLFCLRRRTV